MKHTFSVNMTGKEAADLILSSVYVRRIGVTPTDPNLYLTIRHLYYRQSSLIRNVWTGDEIIELWDHIEFA